MVYTLQNVLSVTMFMSLDGFCSMVMSVALHEHGLTCSYMFCSYVRAECSHNCSFVSQPRVLVNLRLGPQRAVGAQKSSEPVGSTLVLVNQTVLSFFCFCSN